MYARDGWNAQPAQWAEEADRRTIEWLRQDLERRRAERAEAEKELVSS